MNEIVRDGLNEVEEDGDDLPDVPSGGTMAGARIAPDSIPEPIFGQQEDDPETDDEAPSHPADAHFGREQRILHSAARNDDIGRHYDPPGQEPLRHDAPALVLPTSDGSGLSLTDEDIAHYQSLFPGADVESALQKLADFLNASPTAWRPQTAMDEFIQQWLGMANGGSAGARQAPPAAPSYQAPRMTPAAPVAPPILREPEVMPQIGEDPVSGDAGASVSEEQEEQEEQEEEPAMVPVKNAAPPRRKTTTLVLAVTAALMVVGAGAFVVLQHEHPAEPMPPRPFGSPYPVARPLRAPPQQPTPAMPASPPPTADNPPRIGAAVGPSTSPTETAPAAASSLAPPSGVKTSGGAAPALSQQQAAPAASSSAMTFAPVPSGQMAATPLTTNTLPPPEPMAATAPTTSSTPAAGPGLRHIRQTLKAMEGMVGEMASEASAMQATIQHIEATQRQNRHALLVEHQEILHLAWVMAHHPAPPPPVVHKKPAPPLVRLVGIINHTAWIETTKNRIVRLYPGNTVPGSHITITRITFTPPCLYLSNGTRIKEPLNR